MNQETSQQDYLYTLIPSPDFKYDSMLFAAKSSGLYKSTDRGQTWVPAYASLNLDVPLPTTCLALSPGFQTDQTVYAAVEGNILRSKDGGSTWETADLGTPPPVVSSLALSPAFTQDGVLLAGTLQDGVYRSANRGASYTGWNFGLFDSEVNAIALSPDFANDQTVYAGTQSGIFSSRNGGRSWREVDLPMNLAPVLCLALAGGRIYAGTEESGLYLSEDGGDAWKQLAPEMISGGIDQILIDKTSSMLALSQDVIYTSVDGGNTWEIRPDVDLDSPISYIAAPLGVSNESPLWIGLFDGDVIRI